MRDIKKEYKKYVIIYFLVYIAVNILIILYSESKILNISWFFENEVLIKFSIGLLTAPIISILSLIILNCIPDKIKNVLIFWKLQKSLPSYRWVMIIKNDDRINGKALENKYGKSLSPQEQHDIWYKLYKENEKNTIILNSQKDYLFARDLSVSTCILIIITSLISIVAIFNIGLPISYLLNNLIILLVIYLVLLIVSRNSANRFVCNVLAIYS